LRSAELEAGLRLGVAKRRPGSSFRCIDWLGGVLSNYQSDLYHLGMETINTVFHARVD